MHESVKQWEVVATLNCCGCTGFRHGHHILAEYKIAFWSRWVLWEQLGFSHSSSTELESRRWKEKAGKASRTDNILKFIKLLSWISGTYIHSLVVISILFIRMLSNWLKCLCCCVVKAETASGFLSILGQVFSDASFSPWWIQMLILLLGCVLASSTINLQGTWENNKNGPVSMSLWREEEKWSRKCQCRSIFVKE